MPTPAESLARVPLLSELGPDELECLAARTRMQTFPSDETVVEMGDPGQSLYIVLDGEVKVVYPSTSGDFELARLGPGDFFGEMALLNEKPRSATVRTLTPVRTLVLEKEDFRHVVSEMAGLALHLLSALSMRIRNADEQISSLSDQAVRDALTGLLNRRAFHERLNEEVDRHQRYGTMFSLILLDVDHFKSINDSLGHSIGDKVLSWVGRMLQEHTRAVDAPFRIGGEEFAVLCPATEPERARDAAERLLAVMGEEGPPVDMALRVTMSAGYATCPEHAVKLMDVFDVADAALLRAKAAGRNRVADPRGRFGG